MLRIFLSLLITSIYLFDASACTTAIISGKAASGGRPLLWKHRDSDAELTGLVYFHDGEYDYIGLVNHSDKDGKEVWIGYNSAGFAIMNSASYNLKPDTDSTEIRDREGVVMKRALQVCATLNDFEILLDTLPKPLGVEANFGVIDARGGAAYYETGNFSYKKIDVNDPATAPDGYMIRTNYSGTGFTDEGYGYIRYTTAEELFRNAHSRGDLSWKFLIRDVSRSLKHSLTGENLVEKIPAGDQVPEFIHFRDYIPRYSSSSSIVIQGSPDPASVSRMAMWAALGFPPCSVALPVRLNSGSELPGVLKADGDQASFMSRKVKALKDRCFPVTRGSGSSYLNLPVLMNRKGTGIMQQLAPLEDTIIRRYEEQAEKLMKEHDEGCTVKHFYDELDTLITEKYEELTQSVRYNP